MGNSAHGFLETAFNTPSDGIIFKNHLIFKANKNLSIRVCSFQPFL